jgi:hypothetical protein
MEYSRDERDRIQAGFASNAGELLEQYTMLSEGVSKSKPYDATLTICVLQSLLTNCCELIEAMKEKQRGMWLKNVADVPGWFGIRHCHVKENTFSSDPTKLTYSEFIEHLRNALSHPTYPEKRPHLPTSGYTTVPDGSRVISRFRFIDSPWVSRGEILSKACGNNEIKLHTTIREFSKEHENCGALEVRRNSRGRHQIFRGNEPYIPIFEAELPIATLKELAAELANHLAQAHPREIARRVT